MKPLSLFLALILGGMVVPLHSAELTEEQLASIKARLEALKTNLTSHLSTRNTSAAQAFRSAASDPKAAAELYLNCVKLVDYDRKGRPESDFRAWKDGQTDRLRNAQFLTSLQLQLRYLALSCQAVESEDISAVFGPLMEHVDSLSRLTEMPSGPITQPISDSVFAKAYYLDRLFGGSKHWEAVPINISGIYSKTILPYLRENDSTSLMNAWDKRIEQQTRLVATLEEQKASELRGLRREDERRARGNQTRQGGVLGEHAKEEFIQSTLPNLQWGKLKDMFLYVDQVNGASAMLQFIESHLTHEDGERYYSEFEELIRSAAKKEANLEN